VEEAPVLTRTSGKHFPVSIFTWKQNHTYIGDEIDHLWLAGVTGSAGHGNAGLIWRGPMEVKLENVRDHVERLEWGKGARIAGPDLVHVVAEFPQIGSDLPLMYVLQAMLADELGMRLASLGHPVEVSGSDLYVGDGKLNVGVCAATATSCTMHFGVNISQKGEPRIPAGVKAADLSSLVGGDDAMDLMHEVVFRWVDRIDALILKAYKTL
jgi:hypothetical protein